MQAQSSTLQGGMIGNFINIYQQEGTRGLWKVSWLGSSFKKRKVFSPISIILSNPNGIMK